jgi:hypothetical protein
MLCGRLFLEEARIKLIANFRLPIVGDYRIAMKGCQRLSYSVRRKKIRTTLNSVGDASAPTALILGIRNFFKFGF